MKSIRIKAIFLFLESNQIYNSSHFRFTKLKSFPTSNINDNEFKFNEFSVIIKLSKSLKCSFYDESESIY